MRADEQNMDSYVFLCFLIFVFLFSLFIKENMLSVNMRDKESKIKFTCEFETRSL